MMTTGHLADAVKDRRLILGFTQEEAARIAGFSSSTWRSVERGTASLSPANKRRMAATLRWTPEMLDRLLHAPVGDTVTFLTPDATTDVDDRAASTLRSVFGVNPDDIRQLPIEVILILSVFFGSEVNRRIGEIQDMVDGGRTEYVRLPESVALAAKGVQPEDQPEGDREKVEEHAAKRRRERKASHKRVN